MSCAGAGQGRRRRVITGFSVATPEGRKLLVHPVYPTLNTCGPMWETGRCDKGDACRLKHWKPGEAPAAYRGPGTITTLEWRAMLERLGEEKERLERSQQQQQQQQ